MKKGFLFAAAALLAAGAMNAKTIDEVRVYLNPGHGSWGPNDRPMATIPYPAIADNGGRPDTCGFYESNTNLWKVLKLGNTLEKMGVKAENIMYSRVKNGPYPYVKGAEDEELYNRNLSEICEEVDANNMDIFLSVHSNAASEGTSTNYPLYLYRGTDAEAFVEGSKDMGTTMWPIFYTNGIDVTSYYSPTQPNVRGDVSFYGSSSDRTGSNGNVYTGYLGVLKHGAQGFLSEGYFHTYQPARHRALNEHYCGQEGVRYARGLCEWLGGNAETTGYIMGTVKDLHERIQNDLFKYAAGSIDQWLPINGAVVKLYKGETVVATYTVDQNYNGVFVFEGLEPGEYTLDVTAEGYKPLFDEYKAPVTVKANETTYPLLYLESENYVAPTVVYYDYPDEINNPAIGLADEYNFGTTYREAAVAELQGKTVRRSILRGNNLYVLAIDEAKAPYIYVIDATTHEVIKTVGTEGTEGTELAVSDIALTADGVLVGCSLELCHFDDGQVKEGETRGEVNVYKWENDAEGLADGNPAIWFKSTASGNFYRAYTGNTMLYKGTLAEGTIVMTSRTASAVKIYNNIFSIVDGVQVSYGFNNKLGAGHAKDVFGDDYTIALSPINSDKFIITGSNHVAREFFITELTDKYVELAGGLIETPSAKVSYFKYAGRSLMAATDVVEGKPVVKILDITDGLNHATLVGVNTTDEATAAALTTMGLTKVTNDDDGNTTAAAIELMTVNEGGTVTRLTTEGTDQPKIPAAYAYNLTAKTEGGTVTFNFKLSADAKDVNIRIYDLGILPGGKIDFDDEDMMSDYLEIPVGAQKKGAVTITSSDFSGLADGYYGWTVAVESKKVGAPTVIYSADAMGTNARGGVAVDNDPESPFFGTIYVAKGYATGLEVFNRDYELKGTYLQNEFANNGASPFRAAVSEGKVYLTDWSDAHAGVWMFDPASGVDGVTNVFDGTMDSDGCFTNADGVAIGGGTTGISFLGKGEDRKMFIFCEDYPSGNGQTGLGYNIGTADTWNQAPSVIFEETPARMLNTNVSVAACKQGVFFSQTRGSGNNNTFAPAFIVCNHEGATVFNSGNLTDLNGCYGSGLALDNDACTMYIADENANVRVYHIDWIDGVPEFTFKYGFTMPGCSDLVQLTLDYAGNLLGFNRGKGLMVVSLPREEGEEAETPAKNPLVFKNGDITTGIDAAIDASKAVKVYPNPATDVVTVENVDNIDAVEIYNLAGAAVKADATIEGSKATLSVDNLPAGAYILKVNKQVVKLIKK